jgi:hypothetical protein
MEKINSIITGLLLMILISCNSSPTQIFVAPNGSDTTGTGSIDQPFASPGRARDEIRKLKSEGKTDNGVYVNFREGIYYRPETFTLTEEDSGSEGFPIVYTAYNDEKVIIHGGITVSLENTRKITDPEILSRLHPYAQNEIYEINLKSLGINNYGTLSPRGFSRPYLPAPMELFCNYEAMKLARWPNDSLVFIGKVIDPGSVPRNDDFSNRGGKFTYNVDQPNRWKEAKEIWISGFFRYGYADDAVKVADIGFLNKTITTVQPHIYGFGSGREFNRWYAYNLLEEIDVPGEYFIDREKGVLYFYPPEGQLASIDLSVLEEPLVAIENGSYIQFRNITFECARGMGVYIEQGSGNIFDNCMFRNLGQVAISIGKGIVPFDDLKHAGTGTPASRVLGSILAHQYDNTTFNREAGTGHLISGCHIYNTGTGGISLGGGDRLTLEKGNNRVENCLIHDFNRLDRSYKVGINIDGVGNVIRNCEIYNSPGSAIMLHGNEHLIEFNNIHHAVIDGDDMGAIYYGRDPSEFGNKVQYNFFHHIGNEHGMIMAVYHDDGACGMEVTGNVFYKAGSRTVMIGGGNDNVYNNNIFIDCPLAFHLDNRLQGWAKSSLDKDGIFVHRLAAVNYKNEPYSTTYPSLVNYFEDSPGLPKRNFINNTVFVNVEKIHNGKPEWSYLGEKYEVTGDPGFVDAENMNFELKPTSEVFKLLPGFKAIPFSKIGVQKRF